MSNSTNNEFKRTLNLWNNEIFNQFQFIQLIFYLECMNIYWTSTKWANAFFKRIFWGYKRVENGKQMAIAFLSQSMLSNIPSYSKPKIFSKKKMIQNIFKWISRIYLCVCVWYLKIVNIHFYHYQIANGDRW